MSAADTLRRLAELAKYAPAVVELARGLWDAAKAMGGKVRRTKRRDPRPMAAPPKPAAYVVELGGGVRAARITEGSGKR